MCVYRGSRSRECPLIYVLIDGNTVCPFQHKVVLFVCVRESCITVVPQGISFSFILVNACRFWFFSSLNTHALFLGGGGGCNFDGYGLWKLFNIYSEGIYI